MTLVLNMATSACDPLRQSVLGFIVWTSTGQAQTGAAQPSSAQPSTAKSSRAQIRSRLNTQFTASLSNYSIIQVV